MRSAFICPKCLPSNKIKGGAKESPAIGDVKKILDNVSISSRANDDICDYWTRSHSATIFDVFLCHNSDDKLIIRKINNQLKAVGINTWLDEEQLPPGRSWQELLEKQIANIGSVAVFVGSSGTGPWQDMEIRVFLAEFVKRHCPVIPTILQDCKVVPELPLFLRQFTWVDFRRDTPLPLDQLRWGITGSKPQGTLLQSALRSRTPLAKVRPKRKNNGR